VTTADASCLAMTSVAAIKSCAATSCTDAMRNVAKVARCRPTSTPYRKQCHRFLTFLRPIVKRIGSCIVLLHLLFVMVTSVGDDIGTCGWRGFGELIRQTLVPSFANITVGRDGSNGSYPRTQPISKCRYHMPP